MGTPVITKEDNKIIKIIIDNPPVNCLDKKVMDGFIEVINNLEKRNDYPVIIITGKGKTFVAGADINEFSDLDYHKGIKLVTKGKRIFERLKKLPYPVIAAINGNALGGGCELAMAADIRIAVEGAEFGQPEVKLGIIPGYGGTQRLPRLVGEAMAKKLIFTGEIINSREALKFGLIQEVVSEDNLMKRSEELAFCILKRAPLAVSKAKKAINLGLKGFEKSFEKESELFAELCETKDKEEGVEAFINKRKPDFTGK